MNCCSLTVENVGKVKYCRRRTLQDRVDLTGSERVYKCEGCAPRANTSTCRYTTSSRYIDYRYGMNA